MLADAAAADVIGKQPKTNNQEELKSEQNNRHYAVTQQKTSRNMAPYVKFNGTYI